MPDSFVCFIFILAQTTLPEPLLPGENKIVGTRDQARGTLRSHNTDSKERKYTWLKR